MEWRDHCKLMLQPFVCDMCGEESSPFGREEICNGGVPVLWLCKECAVKRKAEDPLQKNLWLVCETCPVREMCEDTLLDTPLFVKEAYETPRRRKPGEKWRKLPYDLGSGYNACAAFVGRFKLAWDEWYTGDDYGEDLGIITGRYPEQQL